MLLLQERLQALAFPENDKLRNPANRLKFDLLPAVSTKAAADWLVTDMSRKSEIRSIISPSRFQLENPSRRTIRNRECRYYW